MDLPEQLPHESLPDVPLHGLIEALEAIGARCDLRAITSMPGADELVVKLHGKTCRRPMFDSIVMAGALDSICRDLGCDNMALAAEVKKIVASGLKASKARAAASSDRARDSEAGG